MQEEDDGIRLDRWFRRHMPEAGFAAVQQLARKGGVKISGKRVEASYRLTRGEIIEISDRAIKTTPPRKAPESSLVDTKDLMVLRSSILMEDEDVIAINKPSGLAVQGGSNIKVSVDSLLPYLVPSGTERPRLVHRLDMETSGVLLVAKSARVAASLSEGFASREAKKIYWALVQGVPQPESGVIDAPVVKQQVAERYEKVTAGEGGKSATTRYRLLQKIGDALSVLELSPLTGRTHQLRVHCAELGCPILGDKKYGCRNKAISALGLKSGLHLHAYSLSLNLKGRVLHLTAPLTGHMRENLMALGVMPDGIS